MSTANRFLQVLEKLQEVETKVDQQQGHLAAKRAKADQ